MGVFRDMRHLVEEVKGAEQTTIVCLGGDLRDVGDESRLKALARERIQDKLRAEGLVALPDVPQYQNEAVYVTQIGSDVAKLSTAMDYPSDGGLKILRGAAGDTQPVIDQQAAVQEAITAIDEAGKALASVANGGSRV